MCCLQNVVENWSASVQRTEFRNVLRWFFHWIWKFFFEKYVFRFWNCRITWNLFSTILLCSVSKICISLLTLLGGSHVTKDEDQFDIDLKDFLQEKYPETDLEELRSKIDSIEIKSIIKSTNGNEIPRLNLKL